MVKAKDGYLAVFALAELYSGFTDKKVILVDKMDGKSLPPTKGPFQVIIQGEKKHARNMWQVISLKVGFAD